MGVVACCRAFFTPFAARFPDPRPFVQRADSWTGEGGRGVEGLQGTVGSGPIRGGECTESTIVDLEIENCNNLTLSTLWPSCIPLFLNHTHRKHIHENNVATCERARWVKRRILRSNYPNYETLKYGSSFPYLKCSIIIQSGFSIIKPIDISNHIHR